MESEGKNNPERMTFVAYWADIFKDATKSSKQVVAFTLGILSIVVWIASSFPWNNAAIASPEILSGINTASSVISKCLLIVFFLWYPFKRSQSQENQIGELKKENNRLKEANNTQSEDKKRMKSEAEIIATQMDLLRERHRVVSRVVPHTYSKNVKIDVENETNRLLTAVSETLSQIGKTEQTMFTSVTPEQPPVGMQLDSQSMAAFNRSKHLNYIDAKIKQLRELVDKRT